MKREQVNTQHVHTQQRGTTLIEIMIAAAIVGLIMTSIVAVITLSIKDVAEAKARSVATKYAQEGIEVYRRQRNLMGWEAFVQSFTADGAGVGGTAVYCMPISPTTTAAFEAQVPRQCSLSSQADYIDSRHIFQRQIDITLSGGGNEVTVLTTIAWEEGSIVKQSTIVEKFQKGNGW